MRERAGLQVGNERLTKGVEHIFDLCKASPTYDGNTIGDTLELIKQSNVDVTKLRRSLKEEVSKRLDAIGYWDFILVSFLVHLFNPEFNGSIPLGLQPLAAVLLTCRISLLPLAREDWASCVWATLR
jgi:hypothetical protein